MLEPGTQVGRYEIQRRLGRGGMGAVYVAHDPVLGRMVAIKVFSGDLELPEARERFSREGRAAASLNHPHIVTVYDFGEYALQPYIVMEYVPGETLAQLIRRKAPVGIVDKLKWMEELCAGAGYAHQMSVIHRDIKPSNLMIDRTGRLKILDFGIARVMVLVPNTAVMVGTPGYMAPEQIEGRHVDLRSDLFSIGVVFYELLTYSEAFPGDTVAAITHRIVSAEPAPLREVAPDVPEDVIGIVEQLLHKDPSQRFADAEAVRMAVSRARRQFASELTGTLPSAAIPPTIIRPKAPPGTQIDSADARSETPAGVSAAGWTPGERIGATPAPTPGQRRTDREAIKRRREEQCRAAVESARILLTHGDLEGAFEACQQALTFNEEDPEALELEQRIAAAFAAREEQADAAVTDNPPSEVLRDDLNAAMTRVTPSALRRSREEGPLAPQPEGVAVADVGATVVALRRTPTAAQTPAPREPQVVGPTSRPTSESRTPAAQTGMSAKPQRPRDSVSQRWRVADLGALARGAQGRTWIVGAIAAVIVIAAAVAVMLMLMRPAPTGILVVDAVPWATIAAIETEDGTSVPLPAQRATPTFLSLPDGNYRVVLVGPPPESQTQRLTVRVYAQTTSPVLGKFSAITPEEYFEQYLAASSLQTEPTEQAPVDPTAAPPVVPAAVPAAAGTPLSRVPAPVSGVTQ